MKRKDRVESMIFKSVEKRNDAHFQDRIHLSIGRDHASEDWCESELCEVRSGRSE